MKNSQADLWLRLESALPHDMLEALEEYKEINAAILSLEYNATLITGLTFQANIQRLLDSDTSEHQIFVKEFL